MCQCKQLEEEEKRIDQGVDLMKSSSVANVFMLCSVCGFFTVAPVARIGSFTTFHCSTCQSVYTVRIELRTRVEPLYKL